jgi:hypothetical protein
MDQNTKTEFFGGVDPLQFQRVSFLLAVSPPCEYEIRKSDWDRGH